VDFSLDVWLKKARLRDSDQQMGKKADLFATPLLPQRRLCQQRSWSFCTGMTCIHEFNY